MAFGNYYDGTNSTTDKLKDCFLNPAHAAEDNNSSANPEKSFEITGIPVSRRSFNPTLGESIEISCQVSKPSKTFLRIYDPEDALIREIMASGSDSSDQVSFSWDGKDLDGSIVPDESYTFTIEANAYGGQIASYDSAAESDETIVEFDVKYDKSRKVVAYQLPTDARVSIRAGIRRGPLLKTLVNWQPRLAGYHEDPWDGMDASGRLSVVSQPEMDFVTEGVALTKNSIIARGNSTISYQEFKQRSSGDRPIKERSASAPKNPKRYDSPIRTSISKIIEPILYLQLPESLPKNDGGLPIVSAKLPVKIFLDEKIKKRATELRYEIICYVDFNFHCEAEEGYSPSTWVLDTIPIPDGKHMLTVNVATLDGQMASASVEVFVKN
jgi:hypothetical protein